MACHNVTVDMLMMEIVDDLMGNDGGWLIGEHMVGVVTLD